MMCRPKPRSRAPVFLSRKLPGRDAADVALLLDGGGDRVGADLNGIVAILDLDRGRFRAADGQHVEQDENGGEPARIHRMFLQGMDWLSIEPDDTSCGVGCTQGVDARRSALRIICRNAASVHSPLPLGRGAGCEGS